jgi:hypothetical protein
VIDFNKIIRVIIVGDHKSSFVDVVWLKYGGKAN